MALRSLTVTRGGLASIFTAALLASACSGSGDVSFDPVAGSSSVGASGGAGSSGGSKQSSAGTSSGGAQNGAGTSSGAGTTAGNGPNAGSSNGGTDAGGTNAGGTDSGGTDAGGTDSGGTDSGGSSGSAGSGGTPAGAGSGGKGGMGGMGGMGGGPSCTPNDEVCDGIDNDCDKVADPIGTCPDGCTGASFAGHVYYFCGVVESAAAAATTCAGYQLGVVAIESEAENDFVISKLKGSSWLGASDAADEQHWTWLNTGATFWEHGAIDGQYHNWQADQPNNDNDNGLGENCAIIQFTGDAKGTWNDLACHFDLFRATCESTGVGIGPAL